ncbi:T9SS type A sorting domain-containing protein [candidate division KSB1 bacterium]|nr:T9SS type A sorting domain-containing protein [candidate division KSB1 bacterium]
MLTVNIKTLSLFLVFAAFVKPGITRSTPSPDTYLKSHIHTKDQRALVNTVHHSARDSNTTLVGRWACGPCYDVDVQRELAFFGNGASLEIADVSDPTIPIKLSQLMLPGSVQYIVANDTHVFVAVTNFGLQIVDVSAPTHPFIEGSIYTGDSVQDLAVSGDYAYVLDRWRGLSIINISDPANPFQSSLLDFFDASGITVSGTFVYIADDNFMHIFDISDIGNPVIVGTCDTEDSAEDVVVDGTYAYVTVSDISYYKLIIIDISSPTHPAEVGRFNFDYPVRVHELAIRDAYVYLCDRSGTLFILNVADPHHPSQVGRFNVPGSPYGVSLFGTYAYVACGSGLVVVDIADKSAPSQVSFIHTSGSIESVAVRGRYAYLAEQCYGLRIIDISDPGQLKNVGFCDTPGCPTDIALSGDYAYVADGAADLRIINISNPANPVEVGAFEVYNFIHDVTMYGNFVFALDKSHEWGLVRIIDVSDPTNPFEVCNFCNGWWTSDVAIDGHYAYLSIRYNGLRILDIADPTNPVDVGECTGGEPTGVAVSNGYAYMTCGYLRIFDVSDPALPVEVCRANAYNYSYDIAVSGDYAYCVGTAGLTIIDISNPGSPFLAGSYATGDIPYGVAVKGRDVYVADGDDGLYIIRNNLVTGLRQQRETIPRTLSLGQNYPNPFNNSTTLSYTLSHSGSVTLKIYTMSGTLVATLVKEFQAAGEHSITFDAGILPSGIYCYQLRLDDKVVATKKMILMR